MVGAGFVVIEADLGQPDLARILITSDVLDYKLQLSAAT